MTSLVLHLLQNGQPCLNHRLYYSYSFFFPLSTLLAIPPCICPITLLSLLSLYHMQSLVSTFHFLFWLHNFFVHENQNFQINSVQSNSGFLLFIYKRLPSASNGSISGCVQGIIFFFLVTSGAVMLSYLYAHIYFFLNVCL